MLGLIESQGYKLKKRGKEYVMLCPFHDEKTPSFSISQSKNCYHCFGCNESGSVIDFVMKTQTLSLPKAVVYLNGENFIPTISSLVQPTPVSQLADIDDDGQMLLHQAIEHYHQNLLTSPEAQEWLVRRGLNNPELVRHFKLGYAGKQGIATAMPSKNSKVGKALHDRLCQLGVIRQSNSQDHFRGCIVVPIIGADESAHVAQRGRVLQLYGRRTQPDYKVIKSSPKHLYLPSLLVGVWNESALLASDEIILCEALIDAMTFWCAGYRHVIAAYGVNGFTADHLNALLHHSVKKVLIAYDRDEAGDNAAEKLAVTLQEKGIEPWRVILPKWMDVNEYALKNELPEHSLGLVLEQAQPMFNPETVNLNHAHAVVDDVPETTVKGELSLNFGSRIWRVRGWQKNHSTEVMKVNVQVRDGQAFHVDSFDMYSAKQRSAYIKQAVVELDSSGIAEAVIKRDIGQVLLKLEQLQDGLLDNVLGQEKAVIVGGDDEQAALELLKSPQLVERVMDDLAGCGVVGESSNLLVAYLAAVSRKLDRPLAVLIQSSSSAGKSSLMDAVLGLMPEEERVQYSAMTGQSLYYLGETNLQHKILSIAEEEGGQASGLRPEAITK